MLRFDSVEELVETMHDDVRRTRSAGRGRRMTDTQPLSGDAAALHATERWFVQHGLPYFVPEEREAARSALHSRRTLVMLVVTALVALAGGVVLATVLGDAAIAPSLRDARRRAWPRCSSPRRRCGPGSIVGWAVGRTLAQPPAAPARWRPGRCRC